MTKARETEQLVRSLVEFLNSHNFEPKPPDEISVELRGPASDLMPDWFTWKIQATVSNSWIETLEAKLPRRYPAAFHYLIAQSRFAAFEVGPIMFFANTGEPVFHELSRRVFADKFMSPFLLQRGFLQFGQAAGGHYDPMCFAPRGLKDKRESRIVRLDHEEILINNRIKVMAEISPSIENFMERTISGEFEVS
ncbi:MAG TPA: hypothetical protein VGL74_02100 [Terriglobales bacterium]